MKELRTIVKAWRTIDLDQTRAALVTLVRVEGSSYRRAGARMLVLEDGTYLGGISGGCLEGDALRRAQKAIALGRSSIVTYDTTQDDEHQIGAGLGCNGIIDVLFMPLTISDEEGPMQVLSRLTEIREPVVTVTITACPPGFPGLGRVIPFENEAQWLRDFPVREAAEKIFGEIRNRLQEEKSAILTCPTSGGELRTFLELIMPATQLVIYGGHHDVHPLVRMAAELGWGSTVVMNRFKADKELTAAAKVLHHQGGEEPLIDKYTAILLMSHDYRTDKRNLSRVLSSPAGYIGMLGPRKRAEKIFEEMTQEGRPLSQAEIQRIHAPAGLDIGAATPEEIALSILAEVRSYFSGRDGSSLRYRQGSIYEGLPETSRREGS